MVEPFLSAVPVLKKLEDAGFEAYFVGGSVRDFLLNKAISDVDIATSATPVEVKKVFSKTVDIGIEHGTVLVLFQNQSYEITTFRTEAEYQDFRRPKEVSFIRNLADDLQRRDFTMNAIAMDKNGNLIDPFFGQQAINEKVIQTVGLAVDRFQEDALRIMRAVRFVSQLSFQIDSETKIALSKSVHLLENIAVERKQAEFAKLLSGINRKQALQLVLEMDIYSFLPGLAGQKDRLTELTALEINRLNLREMWVLLAFFLKIEGKAVEEFYRDWRLPLKEIRDFQLILYYLKKRFEQKWTKVDLFSATKEIFLSAEKLFLVINDRLETESMDFYLGVYENLPIKDRSEMDVTGTDLMAWFEQNGGPWLKETLSMVEAAILERKVVNDNQKIKEWLMKCNQK